jgi:magnesium-transporting ATPase (P-type)
MLLRAWLFLGGLLTICALGCFSIVLLASGWRPGDSVAAASPYHHAYLQATTMTFLAMIAGQIGTAFAVHTEHDPLRSAAILSNRHLLAAIAAELGIAAVIVFVPPLQSLLGTAVPPAGFMALLIPCPLIVWGAERLRRSWTGRHDRVRRPRMPDPLNGRTPVS